MSPAAEPIELLEAEARKVNEKCRGASVVVFGVVAGQRLMVAGSEEMKNKFGDRPDVQNKYKAAVLSQTFNNGPLVPLVPLQAPEASLAPDGLTGALTSHVYDMNVDTMRASIAMAAGPPNTSTHKSGRRNWYRDENCPVWWRATGLPFHSVNQSGPDGKKLNTARLMQLVESLQQHLSFQPRQSGCQNKTTYHSIFPVLSEQEVGESAGPALEDGESVGPTLEDGESAGPSLEDGESAGPALEDGESAGSALEDGESAGPALEDGESAGPALEDGESAGSTLEDGESAGPALEGGDSAGPALEDGDSAGPAQEVGQSTPPVQEVGEPRASAQELGESTGLNQQCASLSERKTRIRSLTFDDTLSMDQKALNVMGMIHDWETVWGLSDCILASFQKDIPSSLATHWRAKKLLDMDRGYKRYGFIPMSIGDRVIYQATPNGNCIYNAVSVALAGSEDLAMMLKLLSVAAISDQLVEFSKYLHEEYQEVASIWCDPSTEATPEAIETFLRDQLLCILEHPYQDGSLLHLLLLCHLLSRPIQQHCTSPHHSEHRQLLHPPLASILHPAAIHLIWVPTRPKNRLATISHVVPAVCQPGVYGTDSDECAFSGLGACALTYGFNCQVTKPSWVCCSICEQWVHSMCMQIPETKFKGRQFPCGCDALTADGSSRIKRMNFYQQLSLETIPDEINLKEIAEGISDSLRTSVFRKPGNSRLKNELRRRLGPFNDNFIRSLNARLCEFICDEEICLVNDIYTPEVLIQIIMMQEKVTRLVAEKILMEVR